MINGELVETHSVLFLVAFLMKPISFSAKLLTEFLGLVVGQKRVSKISVRFMMRCSLKALLARGLLHFASERMEAISRLEGSIQIRC